MPHSKHRQQAVAKAVAAAKPEPAKRAAAPTRVERSKMSQSKTAAPKAVAKKVPERAKEKTPCLLASYFSRERVRDQLASGQRVQQQARKRCSP